MTDLKLGILLWSQAASWAEMLEAAQRVDRLGLRPPLDVGPPVRDLRRPVPADLRGLVGARRVGDGDRADAARAARRRQHVPQPGPRRQDSRRRSTTSAAAGRSWASAAPGWSPSTGPTASTSGRASASASTGSTSRSARCAALLDGGTVTSAPGGRYAFDDLRQQPLPVQPRLPIMIGGSGEKKTLRTVAKYADMWNAMGPLERDGPQDRGPARPLRRRRARHRRDRVHARRASSRSATREAEADRVWKAAMAHNRTPHVATSRTTTPSGTGTPEQIAERLRRTSSLGFRTVISEQPAPFDVETLERFVGEVKPLVERG